MSVNVRFARVEDLPALVRLLADDDLGATRERVAEPVAESYRDAYRAIEADPNNLILVADDEGAVVGTCQLTLIPGLAHQGAWRAQIEAVRVAHERRGQQVGHALIGCALDYARQRGARIAQLTTDKRRTAAHRFYAQLGFSASHEGMKLSLAADDRRETGITGY